MGVTHIQGSWEHSPEAPTGVMAPILNCIFTEIVILWMKYPGLLERDEDPISTYVLLYGCCFSPRFWSLGLPSHSILSKADLEIFPEQRYKQVRTLPSTF